MDLVVFPLNPASPAEGVVRASRQQMRLILLDGRAQIADLELQSVFDSTGIRPERVCIDQREKLILTSLLFRIKACTIRENRLEH